MAFCPHCNLRYETDNDTQPCCPDCGHPIGCCSDSDSLGEGKMEAIIAEGEAAFFSSNEEW